MLETHYTTETKDRNYKKERSNYMTWEQKREVMSKVGEVGLVLLECYYSRSGLNSKHKDVEVARMIGWGERKVQKYRLLLTNNGFFRQITVANQSHEFVITSLGSNGWSSSSTISEEKIMSDNDKMQANLTVVN